MQYLSAFFDLYLFDLYTGGALRTDNLPAGSLIHAESRKFSVQFLSRPRHWSAFQTPNLYLSMWAESLYLYNIGLRETLVKGEMHDQRVEARPLLGGKDPGDGMRVCRIAAQAVDGLGRKGDELPGAQQFGRARSPAGSRKRCGPGSRSVLVPVSRGPPYHAAGSSTFNCSDCAASSSR